MIRTFKHRGLKRLYERGDHSQVQSDRLERIEDILARLDVAVVPSDLDLPGYGLHPLKGKLKGFWAVKVSGNRRIIFRFQDGDILDLNLIDYH
jgi:proteic killer suppression protein